MLLDLMLSNSKANHCNSLYFYLNTMDFAKIGFQDASKTLTFGTSVYLRLKSCVYVPFANSIYDFLSVNPILANPFYTELCLNIDHLFFNRVTLLNEFGNPIAGLDTSVVFKNVQAC